MHIARTSIKIIRKKINHYEYAKHLMTSKKREAGVLLPFDNLLYKYNNSQRSYDGQKKHGKIWTKDIIIFFYKAIILTVGSILMTFGEQVPRSH